MATTLLSRCRRGSSDTKYEGRHRPPYHVISLSATMLGGMLRRFGAAWHAKLGLGRGAAKRGCCVKRGLPGRRKYESKTGSMLSIQPTANKGLTMRKPRGIKASTLVPRDGWSRACCHNTFPGQEQSITSEAHITPAAPALLINLESGRIDHEPTVPQPAVRGQRSRRSAGLRVLFGASYRSESERGHALAVPKAALGRGRRKGA